MSVPHGTTARPILAVAEGLSLEDAQALAGHVYDVVKIRALTIADTRLAGRRVLLWPVVDAERIDGVVQKAIAYADSAAEVKVLDVADQAPDFGPTQALAWGWDAFRAWAVPRAKLVSATELQEDPGDPVPTPSTPAPRKKRPPREVPADKHDTKRDGPRPAGYFAWEGRVWASRMITTDKGMVKPILANAITALSMDPTWKGVLAYDSFAMQAHAVKAPPVNSGTPGAWTDVHDILAAEWLQRAGITVTPAVAAQAVEAVAHDSAFHPVRDYLDRCATGWDKIDRVDHWLVDFVGAADAPYTRAIGRVFLVGAVARIFQPGCKFDTALILEGPQGRRKSTVFDVLGGAWFTDDISELGSKDSKMEVGAAWIIELAELSQMNRGELESTKAFITRRVDKYRPPYGRRLVDRPRQCALGGTCNNSDYLKDDENRRFLPTRVGAIDIEGLRAMRDQLWGEAVHLYRLGEKWWIEDEGLLATARHQQDMRRQGDEWETRIVEWFQKQGFAILQEVTIGQLLDQAIGLPAERWSQADQNRVARVLKSLGWELGWKRVGGHRIKVYRAPLAERTREALPPLPVVSKSPEFEP